MTDYCYIFTVIQSSGNDKFWPIAAYKEPRISGVLCFWEWQVLASSRKFSQLFY